LFCAFSASPCAHDFVQRTGENPPGTFAAHPKGAAVGWDKNENLVSDYYPLTSDY